jgi:hypothetical protein
MSTGKKVENVETALDVNSRSTRQLASPQVIVLPPLQKATASTTLGMKRTKVPGG